jgi:signal transduction histidine kinase
MKTSTDIRDKKRYDTIQDVSLSFKAAVGILNDLLSHDSLESGRLELHNETVAVLPFLLECISPFSAECQERGVTLTFSENPPPLSTSISIPTFISTSTSIPIPTSTPVPITVSTSTSIPIPTSTSVHITTSSPHTHPIDGRTNHTSDERHENNEKNNEIKIENMKKIMMSNSSVKSAENDRVNTSTNDNNALSSLLPGDRIHFDRFKMDQVVRNLISNALKFTPKGGTISVRAYYKYDQCAENRNHSEVDADAFADRDPCCISKNQVATRKAEEEERDEGGVIHVGGEEVVNDIRDDEPLIRHAQCVKNVNKTYNKMGMEMENVTRKNNDTSWLSYTMNFLRSCLLCQSCTPHVRSGADDNPVSDHTCGRLIVEVSDSGAGISIENQKRLFVEIIQFSPEKLQEGGGSGLGLWITSRILNLHRGTIKVHSEGEKKGSLFTFELPMTRNHNVSTVLPGIVSRNPSADQLFTSMTETLGLNCVTVDRFVSHRGAEDFDIDDNSNDLSLDCFNSQLERQEGTESAIDCLNVLSPRNKCLDVSDDVTTVRKSSMSDVITSTPLHSDIILTEGPTTLDSITLDGPRSLDSITLDGPRSLDSITLDGLQTLDSVQCEGPPSIDSLTSGESLFSPILKRNYNILVVDDSRLNRKMLSKCLQLDGHECFEAEDGVQAVAQIRAFFQSTNATASTRTRAIKDVETETILSGSASASDSKSESDNKSKGNTLFDIILMDFQMPNMDGPTATQRIRELGFSGFIFGVTGIGENGDTALCVCSVCVVCLCMCACKCKCVCVCEEVCVCV